MMKLFFVLVLLTAGLVAYSQEVKNQCEITLAPVIPVVKGREIRLHYYNITKTNNADNYLFDCSLAGSGFDNLTDCLRIIAENTGDYPLSVSAIDSEGKQAASASCVVRVVDDTEKPRIKAIFLGDSLTHAAVYLAELKNLMGDNLTLYGTKTDTKPDSTGSRRTVDHEGRSSWAWRK